MRKKLQRLRKNKGPQKYGKIGLLSQDFQDFYTYTIVSYMIYISPQILYSLPLNGPFKLKSISCSYYHVKKRRQQSLEFKFCFAKYINTFDYRLYAVVDCQSSMAPLIELKYTYTSVNLDLDMKISLSQRMNDY